MNFKLKKLFVLVLTLIIVSITGSVFAVDATVGNLALATETTVEQGKEFTVKINLSEFQTSASSVTIIGKIEYDKDKLEYVSNSISSNTAEGWDDVKALGEQCFKESNMGFLFENRTPSKIGKNSNFLTLKFKAKDNVEGNANITVSINSVSDATNFSGDSKTIAITKKAEQVESKPSDEQNPSEEQSKPSDEKNPTEEQSKPKNETGNNTTTNSAKDNTVKTGKLPQTGVNDTLWVIVAVCAVGAVINFVYMKKGKKE